ncbi:diguanylate cyclase domain-containing protein, partial [Actinosynnema sp. NPDC059797]
MSGLAMWFAADNRRLSADGTRCEVRMRSGRPWGVLKGDDRARHDLARHLRGLVDHSELTLKAVGGHCGCSDTTVSKQLAGDQLPPWGFVEAVVDACTPDERRRPERRRAARELWQRAARARRVDLPPAEPGLVDAHTRLVRAQEETIATQRRLIEVTDELSTARRQLLESVQVEHRSSQAIMVLRIVLVRLSALLSRLTSERDRYLAEATRHQAELERTRRELSDTERQRGRARDQLDQAKGERQRASALTELLHDKVNDLEGRLRRSGVTPPEPGTDAVVAPEPGPSTPDEILLDTAAGLDRLQRLLDAHGTELAELESAAAGERPPARPDPDPLPVLLGALSPDAFGPGDPNADTGDGRTEGDKWQAIAEHVRERFEADRAVLRVRADTRAPMRTFVAGEPLPPGMRRDDPRSLREDEMLQLPGTQVRRFSAVGASPGVAEALARRDAREALVAPIRGVSQLLGAVEVHDRSGEGRGFDEGHVDSLRSLARHLSLVVDNRRLLARLRHDAYHDPLTGLLNRPGFREAATEPMRQAETAVVLRIDLDVLSTVSDALGQAWANRMVVAAGRRLRDELGPEVPLARLEG